MGVSVSVGVLVVVGVGVIVSVGVVVSGIVNVDVIVMVGGWVVAGARVIGLISAGAVANVLLPSSAVEIRKRQANPTRTKSKPNITISTVGFDLELVSSSDNNFPQ